MVLQLRNTRPKTCSKEGSCQLNFPGRGGRSGGLRRPPSHFRVRVVREGIETETGGGFPSRTPFSSPAGIFRFLLHQFLAVSSPIDAVSDHPLLPGPALLSSISPDSIRFISMAGWISSTGSGVGNGTGRGAGGRGFPNRRYNSDTIQGGSGSGSGRWRGERSRGRQPPQPQYQYRPVDTANRQSSTSAGTEQETSSTSTRHAQMTHPAAVTNKSPSLVETVAPASSNKETDDSGSPSAANFECNVCFDMAQEPVVTKCGHLFCWECLYQWLHVHSQARECPVCKGEVAEDAIIPIYGRGGSGASMKNAPPRPTGARVESSRQQLHTLPQDMVYVEDDDEEHNPFDFPNMVDFGFGGGPSIREAMRSFMSPSFHDVDIDDQYDDYSYELNPEDFVYDYGLMGFPVFPSAGTEAGNPSSSHMHADIMDLTDSAIPVHYGEFSYSGAPQSRNRGRHGRRHRARASADQSSTDAMVTGASSNFHCDNSANSNGSVGASSRPNTGWVERRGRSNRNSNSAGGRGMYDGR